MRLGGGGGFAFGSAVPTVLDGAGGGGAGEDPGPPFVDLNMRELDGATTVVAAGTALTSWPDQMENVDAIIDPNDGSTDSNGLLVTEDANGTVVTASYSADSRMTCPVDLTQFTNGWTVYSLRKVGDDAPDDGSEMCPDTFGPNDEAYYNDAYWTDGEPENTYFSPTMTGASQIGGPQAGQVYLMVQVADPTGIKSIVHFDGPVLNPQSTRSGFGGEGLFAGGVMLANYPGGGYCLPGPYVRFLVYPTAHTEAEMLFVRQMLRDENAGTDYAFTLRDVVPPPPPPGSIAGTITGVGGAIENATVTLLETSGPSPLTSTMSAVDGSYSFADVEPGTYFVTVDPPEGDTDNLSTFYVQHALAVDSDDVVVVSGEETTVDIEMLEAP